MSTNPVIQNVLTTHSLSSEEQVNKHFFGQSSSSEGTGLLYVKVKFFGVVLLQSLSRLEQLHTPLFARCKDTHPVPTYRNERQHVGVTELDGPNTFSWVTRGCVVLGHQNSSF